MEFHPDARPEIAIIIPACDEEPVIGVVLRELLAAIDRRKFVVVVGANGCSDRTADVARQNCVLVAETPQRGYGYGCTAAVRVAESAMPSLRAFVFYAADGASDPRDIPRLVRAYERGYSLVLGARTAEIRNWPVMGFSHVVANAALAAWCALLSGRCFKDLAPLRLIDRVLFHSIAPQEMTYGWTIEAQIAAAKLKASICQVSAGERRRLAGQQKVSGVTWRRTALIGCRIVAAGYRTWKRMRQHETASAAIPVPEQFVIQPQRGA